MYATQLVKSKLVHNRKYVVSFLGPTVIRDTRSIQGIFELFHVLEALTQWGLNVYKPWFEKNILARSRVMWV